MNKIILIGRPTSDVEVYQSNSGNTVARYTLAVNRMNKREGEPTADFIRCVAFNRPGEFAEKYIRKGMRIAVTGHIQTGSYINKSGQKVFTTDVAVESQELLEKWQGPAGADQSHPASGDDYADASLGFYEDLPFN